MHDQVKTDEAIAEIDALLTTLRIARERGEELRACCELLRVSLELLRDRDREIDQLRRANVYLRAQLRALMTGKTINEERALVMRQELDDAKLEPMQGAA